MTASMKKIATALLLTTSLTLGACGQLGQQWIDPDRTFASLDQPTVKGINDTQEDMAKEAVVAGDYARAAQFYQQLVSEQKGSPEQKLRYKMGLADAVRRMGRNENALALYEELFAQNPKNLDIAEGRALTLMANGKTADAGRAFSDILEQDPKRWRTLNALGILFVTKNMVPEAMAYYTEALNQSPDNAAILNNVGLSQAVDRNFTRATEALQQASRVSKVPSQRKQIELNLAMVYGISGDLETAHDVAEKYLDGPALDNNLGLYAHLAKDDALAKSYLNMALSQSPTYYERAWENLDALNDAGHSDSTDAKPTAAPKPSAIATLPKLDATPTPAASGKRTWHKGKKLKKATAAPTPTTSPTHMLPEVSSAPAEAAKPAAPVKDAADKEPAKPAADHPDTDADKKPADAAKPDAKPEGKPAGLVVGPGEGN